MSPSIPGGDMYLRVNAQNAAGTPFYTTAPVNFPSPFNPGGLTLNPQDDYDITCGNVSPGVDCPSLADQQSPNMGGDLPWLALANGDAFSGYLDPSMRRDPIVSASNPNGANLWMLYSYPRYDLTGSTYSGAAEVHLAMSPNGSDGNSSWAPQVNSYCQSNPSKCTVQSYTQDSPYAVWPTVYNSGTGFWSSHEVSNFWPYHGSWYAAHLMYFVKPAQGLGVPYGISNRGCLVTTVAGTTTTPATPVSLGDNWDTNSSPSPPYQCPPITSTTIQTGIVTGPNSSSNAIPYGYLTQAAVAGYPALASDCTSNNVCIWGEPAIMVLDNALTGNAPTAYLAVDCHTQYVNAGGQSVAFVDNGYFIFSTTDLTLGSWNYYGGPFVLSNLLNNPNYPPNESYPSPTPWNDDPNQAPNALTEFDWALRSDGQSLVAVVTPSFVPSGGSASETQYGCTVVDFSLANAQGSAGNPFLGVIATITDLDANTGAGTSEVVNGANGCTYEPTSNTGIIIVRQLVKSTPSEKLYSLIETGIMP
jgi:hypothetical protein